MSKPTVLVVVSGGVAESWKRGDVDVRIIDMDNFDEADYKVLVPDTEYFRELVKLCDVGEQVTFVKEPE